MNHDIFFDLHDELKCVQYNQINVKNSIILPTLCGEMAAIAIAKASN